MTTARRNLLQESIETIAKLQARLQAAEFGNDVPIAIIGAACRYPGGVTTPEAYWELLEAGRDGTCEVPADRWNVDEHYSADPKVPNRMNARRGGFVDGIDMFDPQFFGMSPREAASLDPQQRMLMECAHESMERAGIATDKLAGSATGVFIGITCMEYQSQVLGGTLEGSDVYAGTGGALNAASGRISFTYGLQGPCVSVDTACSSSLVAVHLACQSLRAGESSMALAGGVNLNLLPNAMILFSKWGMLAPDGQCKTFDAAADGFVRSEGCGVIVLKRLADAIADGDQVLALIKGSACNSDGRSSGLTVPNGPAQQAVLRKALQSARLGPADIDYVEAHGTGTPLGDPIEVEALGSVFGEGRPHERPLLIGSVKTNFGHIEAGSGMAGLLKVVLSLQNEAIPKHLHFKTPNPGIAWADLPVKVPTQLTPWPRGERVRRAGVSSFGFSGTNAHVILEEAPARGTGRGALGDSPVPMVLPLSARNETALRQLVLRHADAIESAARTGESLVLQDIARTLSTGRAAQPRRLALVADSTASLLADLHSYAGGTLPPAASEHQLRSGERPGIAFLFTGQGSQYAGMGRGLYESEPVFRSVIDRAAELLAPQLPKPLTELLFAAEADAPALDQTAVTQPALFAVEFALAELWRSWGVVPSAVIGHSVGEYVAACVAGVFSFEEGLALVAERGRLMQALPAGGAMAAVFCNDTTAISMIGADAARVAIAGVNGPEETVISGAADAVAAVLQRCAHAGLRSKALEVSHAFHSHLLDPMLDALTERARQVVHKAPRIPLVSNLSGDFFAPGTGPDAAYWAAHARGAVRFADGARALQRAGVTALVEAGPHPALLALAQRAVPDARWSTHASLRRGRDGRREILASVGALFTLGASLQWSAIVSPVGGRSVALPTYPFQRERHWFTQTAAARPASGQATGSGHPLLGQRQRSPSPGTQFLAEIAVDRPSFFAEHVVLDNVLLPSTGYVEMAVAAARELWGEGHTAIEGLKIEAPCSLQPGAARLLHLDVSPEQDGKAAFVVRSTNASEAAGEWRVHARGSLRRASAEASGPASVESVAEVAARCISSVDVDEYYAWMRRAGLGYGPAFRSVRSLSLGDGEAVGTLSLPEATAADGETLTLHPALLDSVFHLLAGALFADKPEGVPDRVYLPIGIEHIYASGIKAGAVRAWSRLRPRDAGAAVRLADLRLEDMDGRVVALLTGLQLREITTESLAKALALPGIAARACDLQWQPVPLPDASTATSSIARAAAGAWVLLADTGGVASTLADELHATGQECLVVDAGSDADVVNALNAGSSKLAWVVDCRALDDMSGQAPEQARANWVRLVALAQSLSSTHAGAAAGLAVLTRGAHAIAARDEARPEAMALVGLARTLAAERGDAPALRLDLDPSNPVDTKRVLQAFFTREAMEPELGLRDGAWFAPRLKEPQPARARPSGQREVLRIEQRGSLDDLSLQVEPRALPGPDEVEIEVRAAGLNFRDVLNALGMYPGDAGPLGSECSGVVSAVGAGVTQLAVGDEVVAFAVDSFASHVTTPARLVVRKPENIGFADAVTVPNCYLTAALCLHVVAGIKRGQRVLIHSAAGGVGLAAVRLARLAGAEVIATAGNAEKRAFVLGEGASHVFDSRSTSFEQDVMQVTRGEGVDILLNSLAGEFIAAGMRVVRPGGWFVEIGKTTIWTPEEAAARAPHVRYEIADLGLSMAMDTPMVRELLSRTLHQAASGELAPLPLRTFALADAAAAFRHMATGRHIGKLVLVPRADPAPAPLALRRDGTYLVTGGLGGLGLAVGGWLAQRGAGHVVLLGRQPADDSHRERLAAIEAAGAHLSVVRCDVGDERSVAHLFDEVLPGLPRLRGIVHAAGVLDDAPLADQQPAGYDRVAAPKVDGAWHLHRRSLKTPLDLFVMFSSSSALFGSPGQANYAAANAFLDGLASRRKAHGLAGTSIGWGAWGEVGMASRLSDATLARWQRLGLGLLAPADALMEMEKALLGGAVYRSVAAVDSARILANAGPGVRALHGVLAPAQTEEPNKAAGGDHDILAAARSASSAPAVQRLALLQPYVHARAAKVLGFSAAALDADTPLSALGFDSLMAVQFRNLLEGELAIDLPLAQLLGGPTVSQLSQELATRGIGANDPLEPVGAEEAWEEGSL